MQVWEYFPYKNKLGTLDFAVMFAELLNQLLLWARPWSENSRKKGERGANGLRTIAKTDV